MPIALDMLLEMECQVALHDIGLNYLEASRDQCEGIQATKRGNHGCWGFTAFMGLQLKHQIKGLPTLHTLNGPS